MGTIPRLQCLRFSRFSVFLRSIILGILLYLVCFVEAFFGACFEGAGSRHLGRGVEPELGSISPSVESAVLVGFRLCMQEKYAKMSFFRWHIEASARLFIHHADVSWKLIVGFEV